jgi:hypothetical protein
MFKILFDLIVLIILGTSNNEIGAEIYRLEYALSKVLFVKINESQLLTGG